MLVVQHQDDCPPGVLATWAEDRAVELTVVRPDRDEPLPDPSSVESICVLGSDRSVNDDVAWIRAELDWLRDAVKVTPVLGICFGAQALAVALGGEVHREPAEIDWLSLEVSPELGCGGGPWLCWHNDFITAPAGATVLARSSRAVHAFALDRHLAVQFHPEVTAGIIEDWMGAADLGRDLADAGIDHDRLRLRSAQFAPAAGVEAWRLFDAFERRRREGHQLDAVARG